MSIPAPRTTALELPVAGTAVTYHGSMTEHQGGRFLLFPHYSIFSTGEHDAYDCEDLNDRSTLVGFGSYLTLNHARPASFTADTGIWWPQDAIDITRDGYVYKVSHTLPGGGPHSRVIAFHAADGRLLRDWARLHRIDSDTLQLLDERGLTRADQKTFAVPAQRAS
ncbi:hypothetical protein AB0C71_38025 [Streptomyces anulatus]|uniref:hypothetical protein n=1 Tax=Streptomyces anulatus TaxID=1892 RepID=UPI00340EE3B4